jgi:hypothetical protein
MTARKDGRVLAVLTIAGDGLTVLAETYPGGSVDPVPAGPYHFFAPAEASEFVDEAVDALTYLGCEID